MRKFERTDPRNPRSKKFRIKKIPDQKNSGSKKFRIKKIPDQKNSGSEKSPKNPKKIAKIQVQWPKMRKNSGPIETPKSPNREKSEKSEKNEESWRLDDQKCPKHGVSQKI